MARVPRHRRSLCRRSWTRSCACMITWRLRAEFASGFAFLPPLVHLFRASPLQIPVCPFTALVSPVAPLNTPCRSYDGEDAPSRRPEADPPFRCVQQLWFMPTLLRNSRIQHHPWVWCAGSRNRRVRAARDAPSCHPDCIKSCRVLHTCHSALGPYHLWRALIAAAAEGAAATDPRHPGSHPSRDALPLPRHAEARGGDGGRDGSPLHGRGVQGPGGQCSLREAVPAPGKRGTPGRGHPVSAGVAATTSCSAAAHGSFLGSLVLTNPSNYCYLNSAIRALLWTLSAVDRHFTEAQASSCHWGLTSAGLQAYRFLRNLPPSPHFL